jgi:hypothetical protein
MQHDMFELILILESMNKNLKNISEYLKELVDMKRNDPR